MLNKWETINPEQKALLYLGLSEAVIGALTGSEYWRDARKALDVCWNWLDTKKPTGDEIYEVLDDGTEFGGLFILMQMDENPDHELKWDCIVDAVSFVDKQAYSLEGAKYLPAPIENVEDNLIEHFLECFYSISVENRKMGLSIILCKLF